jgi:hypothetical protein
MQAELKALQIDRSKKSQSEPSRWATRRLSAAYCYFFFCSKICVPASCRTEVTVRVHAESSAAAGPGVT